MNGNIRLSFEIIGSKNEIICYSGFNTNNKSEVINKFIRYMNKNENKIWS